MVERHVLVVLPHPDDESMGAGGTIALHTQAGISVTYACGTLGQMGRNMGLDVFANRETMPMIRKQELQDACAVLGIQDLRMLGFHDKTLEFEDVERVADVIEKVIWNTNPSLIITFYPGEAVHPDHDAFGLATVTAVSRMPKEQRPVVYAIAITRNKLDVLGEPDVVIDVSDVLETKLDAIRAHRSQTEAMMPDLEKGLQQQDEATLNWLRYEQFYIYKFD